MSGMSAQDPYTEYGSHELVETCARTTETKLSRGVRLCRRITEYYE